MKNNIGQIELNLSMSNQTPQTKDAILVGIIRNGEEAILCAVR